MIAALISIAYKDNIGAEHGSFFFDFFYRPVLDIIDTWEYRDTYSFRIDFPFGLQSFDVLRIVGDKYVFIIIERMNRFKRSFEYFYPAASKFYFFDKTLQIRINHC